MMWTGSWALDEQEAKGETAWTETLAVGMIASLVCPILQIVKLRHRLSLLLFFCVCFFVNVIETQWVFVN